MKVLRPEWTWTPEGVRKDWCVTVDAGQIVRVGPADRHSDVPQLEGRLLLPGLVNAHSHAFQRAFRGHVQWRSGEHDDFWTWRDTMYRCANAMSPEGVEAISRLAFLEMAEAGITWVGEFHYLHHQQDGTPYADPDELAKRVVAAARDVGIRITLLRAVYGRHSAGRPLEDNQLRFGDRSAEAALAAVDRLGKSVDPLVTVGLAPHSVRAVPPEWLPELASWGGPIHAHVAEQQAEVDSCRRETGLGPLGLLASKGLVSERFVAVHMTCPDPGDLQLLASVGASLCACPTTELDLGDGFLPLGARGGRLCLGSDSHAQIDLLQEARALEMHARGLARRRNVMSPIGDDHGLATRLLAAATGSGARALGASDWGIREGGVADLVAIDLRRTAAEGVPPLEAAVFVGDASWVTDVWVAGRPIIVDGRHPRGDSIVQAARSVLQR